MPLAGRHARMVRRIQWPAPDGLPGHREHLSEKTTIRVEELPVRLLEHLGEECRADAVSGRTDTGDSYPTVRRHRLQALFSSQRDSARHRRAGYQLEGPANRELQAAIRGTAREASLLR